MMNQQKTGLSAVIAVLVALGPAQLPAADSAMGSDFAIDRDNAPVLTPVLDMPLGQSTARGGNR